jgi:hypothetical protein
MKNNTSINLIGLCGFAFAGKDTAAANMSGFTRHAFADRLKKDLLHLLDEIGCKLTEPTHKAMARDLLVEWGRTARKFKPDHWITRAFDDHEAGIVRDIQDGNRVVITDVRYPNECERVLSEGGVVIMIRRPGIGPANKEEALTIDQIVKRWPTLPYVMNDKGKEDIGKAVLERAMEVMV